MAKPAHIELRASTEPSVAGILAIIETAAARYPLRDRLCRMCSEVARITNMDVVSAYALEPDAHGEDRLVMRGNVGFPRRAIGNVSLRMGEGITGMVAECMTTASVAVGYQQAEFKAVPGLPEHEFPCFVGIPLRAGGGVCGVLVLQRRDAKELTPTELALATALAAPFVFAFEQQRERSRGQTAPIRMIGTAVSPGVALGRSAALPSLGSLSPRKASHSGPNHTLVTRAFERLRRELGRTTRRLSSQLEPALARRLAQIELIVADSRMEAAIAAEAEQVGVAAATYRVALRYAHAPYQTASSPASGLVERSKERESLCVLVRSTALGHEILRRGTILCASRLTGLIALAAAARGITAIAVEAAVAHDAVAAHIARAADIPVVAGIPNLLASTPSSERVIVDAETGEVRLRPTATEIARIKNR